jgi:hypothetical protein
MNSEELSNLVFKSELFNFIFQKTEENFKKESQSQPIIEEFRDWIIEQYRDRIQEIIDHAKKEWNFKIIGNRCFLQLSANIVAQKNKTKFIVQESILLLYFLNLKLMNI